MKSEADIYKLIKALEQMETGIIEERKKNTKAKGSLFSYWLYESRVKEYQKANKPEENIKLLEQRLRDVICQQQINREDASQNGEMCPQAEAVIAEAEKWLEILQVYISK